MTIRITATARLVADPELRFAPSGRAVASLRVASNQRRLNRDTNEWEDGDSTFIDVTVFGAKAEAVAESLRKGQLVLIAGNLKSRQYENREGQKVTAFEILADEIAPIITAQRNSQQAREQRPQAKPTGGDPWRQANTDEAPF